MSTESIASSTPPLGASESCMACGAPLAEDQRYCLECGERRFPMSSVLLGGPPAGVSPQSQPGAPSSPPPPPAQDEGRGNAVTVIAAVGVLLLAVGVGVLIGRSGGSKPSSASAPEVINVSTGAAAGATQSGSGAASFSDDWPAGTNGYTVQLQSLPQSSTQVSAVEAAKAAASAKGAKAVGALKSEHFNSLTPGDYVIYSGVYHTKTEAMKALKGLKKSFSGASVITVSNAAASSKSKAPSASSGGSVVGSSESHPAPPSVVESLKATKGKSYEEKSKNLPNVISTG